MLKLDEVDSFNNSSQNGLDILKQSLCGAISGESRARIEGLVQEVAALKDIEKLLFCLLLPVDATSTQHSFASAALGFTAEDVELSASAYEFGSLGMGLFPPCGPASLHLSNQVEQSQAYTWIMSHLEEDSKTCLRKDEVFEDYRVYCEKHHMKTLNTADFGKVMKRAYPNVKPRRLGQRGQSRYCYGGMRKKMEVQPPFLPDLTDEALSGGGASASLANLGQSTASPASSISGASGGGGGQGGLCSPASLARVLHPANGHDPTGASGGYDAHVWSVLGLRGGPVVADVAHLLLEYAHQVFGVNFHSLFHLAHHLVTNRYVNSRSRHALALIAHAANGPPLSPPPSTALAEALQKGVNKSAFGRVGNGRMKSNASQRSSHVKAEDDAGSLPPDSSRTPIRYPTGGSGASGGVGSNSPLISTPTSSNSLGLAHLQPLTDRSSSASTAVQHSLTGSSPFSLTADLSAVQHLPTCSTPQPMSVLAAAGYQQQGRVTAEYQANFSPQTTCTIASALASQAVALGVTSPTISSHYSHPFSMSAPTCPLPCQTPTGMLRHPTAAAATLAAAAAAAAHHRQQQQQQYLSSLPDQLSVYGSRQIAGDFPLSISAVSDTALRLPNKEKQQLAGSGFALSSTDLMGYSGYQQQQQQLKQSPAAANNNNNRSPQQQQVYAAHQQAPSPYQCSQQGPPVPLPPGVTVRSAYTPVGQPPVGSLDHHHQHQQHHQNTSTPPSSSSAASCKRAPPNPVDAPGAYEPSPRFHLGGQSPTKRTRYVSTNTGSGTTGCSLPPVDSLNDRQHLSASQQRAADTTVSSRESAMRLGYPTTTSTTDSASVSRNETSSAVSDYTNSSGVRTPGQRGLLGSLVPQSPSPHYFQHSTAYDASGGGGHAHLSTGNRSHLADASMGETWPVSRLPSTNGKMGSHYQSAGFRDYLVSTEDATSGSGGSSSGLFRPPVTPFSLKLDDCDELTNLPRLGSSPGPQIPPSSPTEFLPFYSEAASKAKRQHQQHQHLSGGSNMLSAGLTPSNHGSSSSEGEDQHYRGGGVAVGDVTRPDTSLETPPSSTRHVERSRVNHSGSSTDSEDDDPKNRTLTRYDPVTTPPLPGGLANVPSPSECGPQRTRDELETPSPVNDHHCLSSEPETSSTGSCPSSTEVKAC